MARDRRAIGAVLALVGAYRLLLLGRGALAFVDETLYFKATMALRALASGHLRAAVFDVVTNNARPGDAIVKMLPAALQAIPFAFGVPSANPLSLLIPTACNVAVSLVVVWLVFRLCERFSGGDGLIPVVVTVAYALLASSNVYVRHLFPYDWALALALWAIWLACSRPATDQLAGLVGLMAGGVVLIYPGYYPLVGVIACAAAGAAGRRLTRASIVVGGAAVPLLVVEAAARWAGFSYLASARQLSATIVGGSFDEGWVFLPRYLLHVEGAIGVVLLAGFAAYLVAAAIDIRRRGRIDVVHWIVGAAAAGWIWQAALSAVLHKMVLYGRLIHPWVAVLSIALAVAIRSIPWAGARVVVCAGVVMTSFASWSSSAGGFYRLAYPRDVLHALSIDARLVPPERRRCEFEPVQVYDTPPPIRGRSPVRDASRLTMLNMCQGFPLPGWTAASTEAAVMLFDGPHFERYPAYQFEGYTPEQRALLSARDYRVRVYER